MASMRKQATQESRSRAQWHVMVGASLTELEQAAVKVAAAQGELDVAVRRARASGVSWAVIAAAAGVSRDTARRRYGGM